MERWFLSMASCFREPTRIDVHRCLSAAYVLLIVAMFVLPFYSAEGYSILRNTTSHLKGTKDTKCLDHESCICCSWCYMCSKSLA